MRRHPFLHARRAYLLPAVLLASLAAACVAGSSGAAADKSAAKAAAAAAAPGLVGAYSFDASSGNSLADSSGSGNTGTLSGPTWAAGKTGNALSFDGVNDWVTIADSASLDLTSGMTLEAWVRPQGSGWRTIAFKERPAGLSYALYSSTGANRPSGELRTSSGFEVSGPAALPSGTWSHLATTYNGSTLRLYVNGAQVASRAATGTLTTSSSPLRIGGNNVWAEWFSGQIDDLRIYNRALTAAELQTDMNTPVGGTPPPPADTQAPSAPAGLVASGQTQTQLTLGWNASTDNVGVTGYSRYLNGNLVSSATGTSFAFTGLACGTSYTLAVDAYDAAGNRSSRPSITAATQACPAASGPVAAYSFDAGSGTSLADATGSGNNGAISGATWTTAGRTGGALTFDGVNDLVTVADRASLDLTTGMTLEAWIRPTANSTWRTVVTKETSGNLTYGLFSNSDAPQPSSIVSIGSNPIQDIARGTTELSLTGWTHLASTYDGAALRLYVNGVQVATANVTGAMANSSGPLQIGGNNVWPEWFQGQIDDLRIYNRPLTAAQLQADMNTPVGGTPPPADTQAPSAPGSLAASGQTQTQATLSWNASSDNVGVTGYSYYRNGTLVGNGTGTTYTFTGLACGTSYTLAVDAYDAAGNRSTRPSISASTSACSTADTQAPTAPGNLVASGQTQTQITLGWNASSDNVGVTGYSRYRNGTLVSSATGTSFTFTGLTCGTSYTLAVDAYDAAGNRSTRPSISASTSACSPPPPPSGSANLWVDVNGGSCARQATAGGYNDAQACSWSQAYQAASTGDVILVKGGSYGNVTMGANKASIVAPGVTYRTATGETVTMNDFQNGHIAGSAGANNITIVGPVTSRTVRIDRASNVTIDGWRVDCNGCVNVQTFHIESATNILVRNSDISDNTDNSLMWINGTNLTFENNVIHDAGLRAGSGAHTECMYVWSVTNLTLKRNHFYHCSVMDVFITGNAVSSGGYIENNVFEQPWSSTGVIGNGLAFHFRNGGDPSPDPSNWDFRYNTFVGTLSISGENPVGSGGMRVIGNVFLRGSACGKSNTTYSFNAFVSGACGTNSITNSLATYQAGFVSNGDPGNYALKSGSVLVGKGNPTSYPSVDRPGSARTSTNDIGAYEYMGG